MLNKGEPLSRELRFRLRAYTGIVLIGFFAFHISAFLVLGELGACQAFGVPYVTAGTVRIVRLRRDWITVRLGLDRGCTHAPRPVVGALGHAGFRQ